MTISSSSTSRTEDSCDMSRRRPFTNILIKPFIRPCSSNIALRKASFCILMPLISPPAVSPSCTSNTLSEKQRLKSARSFIRILICRPSAGYARATAEITVSIPDNHRNDNKIAMTSPQTHKPTFKLSGNIQYMHSVLPGIITFAYRKTIHQSPMHRCSTLQSSQPRILMLDHLALHQLCKLGYRRFGK